MGFSVDKAAIASGVLGFAGIVGYGFYKAGWFENLPFSARVKRDKDGKITAKVEVGSDSSSESEDEAPQIAPVAKNFNNKIKYDRKETGCTTILQRSYVGDPKNMPTAGENFNNDVEVGGEAINSRFFAKEFINGEEATVVLEANFVTED